ncbi:lipopolysaccharide transport periplasmic protein LptA, partial [Burkholderia contaminans]
MNESFPRQISGGAARAVRAALAATLVALPLVGLAPLAHAEKADQSKPINVEADNLTYDDLKQVTVATGNVVITKGTIIIKGDRVEVRQDPEGYQYATSFGSGKKHATFRQKREGLDEYIDGDAERIDYDGKQDLTTLTTAATGRRLPGTSTIPATVHGSVITYDGQRDSSPPKGGTARAARRHPHAGGARGR